MSIRSSAITLASVKGSPIVEVNEKAKLVSLIRTWRTKYDKAHAISQRYHDIIETLKNDLKRLKVEKNTVTDHLTLQLHDLKENHAEDIKKIREEHNQAIEEAEKEQKTLRSKIIKLRFVLQSATSTFKERDEKNDNKIVHLSDAVYQLHKEKEKFEKEKEENQQHLENELHKVKTENEELKDRFQTKMEEIKKLTADKIAQVHQQVEAENEQVRKQIEDAVRAEAEAKEAQKVDIATTLRQQLTEKKEKEIAKIKAEHQTHLHTLTMKHAEEIKTMQQQMGTSSQRSFKNTKEKDGIRQELIDATAELRAVRKKFSGSIYSEIFDSRDTSRLEPSLSSKSMKSLLDDLALHMSELKGLRKIIIRHEQQSEISKKNEITWHQKALKLELDHHAKVAETENLKKLIRLKQLFSAYKNNGYTLDERDVYTIPVSDEYFTMAESDTRRSRRPTARILTNKHKDTQRGLSNKSSFSKARVSDERSQWLTRKNSTVQFNPTTNGRNVLHTDTRKTTTAQFGSTTNARNVLYTDTRRTSTVPLSAATNAGRNVFYNDTSKTRTASFGTATNAWYIDRIERGPIW